jgi:phosphohistidine phosphatase SixA
MTPELSQVWTSPARRCRHTAEIVASHLGVPGRCVSVQEALAAGSGADGIIEILQDWVESPASQLLVAHQPDLEDLASALLGATEVPVLSLQPGGCALLRLVSRQDELRASMQWLLTPAWFELVAGI